MTKAKIRWCSCRVENILTLGKLTDPPSAPKAPGQSRIFTSIFFPQRIHQNLLIVPEILLMK